MAIGYPLRLWDILFERSASRCGVAVSHHRFYFSLVRPCAVLLMMSVVMSIVNFMSGFRERCPLGCGRFLGCSGGLCRFVIRH